MRSVGRAADKAAKDRRSKRRTSSSDSSDDSHCGKDSRNKKAKQLERELLKAREEEKALKLQLQAIQAKNEEAKEKLMHLAVVPIFSIFLFYSISDAVYIAPGAIACCGAHGFPEFPECLQSSGSIGVSC